VQAAKVELSKSQDLETLALTDPPVLLARADQVIE
jgi:hypothetical protein